MFEKQNYSLSREEEGEIIALAGSGVTDRKIRNRITKMTRGQPAEESAKKKAALLAVVARYRPAVVRRGCGCEERVGEGDLGRWPQKMVRWMQKNHCRSCYHEKAGKIDGQIDLCGRIDEIEQATIRGIR